MRYLLLPLGLTIACTDVKSSAIDTSGIYLSYTVLTEGEGLGSEATVGLNVGGALGSFVELEGGDRLTVTVGEESNVLDMSSLFVIHSYGSVFTEDAAGSVFTLNFERESLTQAPESTATLPEPFELTAPEDDLVISRSEQVDEELLITWDGTSNEPMEITIEGDCFSHYLEVETNDSGEHSVPVSYFSENESDAETACTATIVIKRKSVGTVDPAFDGGTALGIQARTLDIRIDP